MTADLTPLLRSLGEDASILEAAHVGSVDLDDPDYLDDLIAQRESEDHPCLVCGKPAEYAYVLHHETHGLRWLDLCGTHAQATGQANDDGVFGPAEGTSFG